MSRLAQNKLKGNIRDSLISFEFFADSTSRLGPVDSTAVAGSRSCHHAPDSRLRSRIAANSSTRTRSGSRRRVAFG